MVASRTATVMFTEVVGLTETRAQIGSVKAAVIACDSALLLRCGGAAGGRVGSC